MERDFDDAGKLKRGAVPEYKQITSLSDLNAGIFFDEDSWAEVQIFKGRVIEKLRECSK
jgi:hypothetical protein